MMLRFTWIPTLGLALSLGACGSAVDVAEDTDTGSSTSSDGTSAPTSASTTASGVTTNASATSGTVTTADPSEGTSSDGSSTGADDAGFIMPDTGGETSTEPQPLGGQCASNEECDSSFCYVIPQVGGVCSECLVDQDCEAGTCSLDAVGYALCTDGSQGNMCNTDEGCMGELVCTELIDTGGIINTSFCSECGPTADCDEGLLCTPEYNLEDLGGSFVCVTPGTVEDGQGCPVEGGIGVDEACVSGHCGLADLFGFAQLGVCGECNVDEDCPEMGQVCVPAEAGMTGLTPAFCQ